MATYNRRSLPAMRITSRPTRGPKRITSVNRGVSHFRDCETGRSVLSQDASNHHQLAPSESAGGSNDLSH